MLQNINNYFMILIWYFKTIYFLYLVTKVQQPYRAPPKNTVGNRGDNGKIEELSAQVC